jgi:glycosyltransferase involved in cell wall biosynthesis
MGVRSVLVLNDFCHVQGGASRVAVEEAVALQTHGLDVTFLGAVGPICEELRAAGVRTICLEQPELADAGSHPQAALLAIWNQRAYRRTRSLLAGLDAGSSVVHLHGYTKALSTAPALAAARAGFRVVCTLHDFFAACPNGAFYDYRAQSVCTRGALSAACVLRACDKRHPLHKAYRVTRGLAQRHLARFPASVRDFITLSDRSAAVLRPYLPRDARFHRLENVIAVTRAPPVDVAANEAFAVVGRLDAEKGVLLAARAARDANQPIVFIGDGPLRAEIEATGARVTGWLAPAEVPRELLHARCLVFPSLWYETYGLVVSEAAARGIPAIVSDISAAAERIADGEDGWIFPSGDIAGLARCMALARDPAKARMAGSAAWRKYWDNPSDPARHAAGLVAIYDTMLARSGAACAGGG